MGEYIERGWEIVKKNLGLLILYTLLLSVAISVVSVIPVLGVLAIIVVAPSLVGGYLIFIHRSEKGEHTEFNLFFKGFDFLLPLFLGAFIGGILVGIGNLLLIIPGIYLSVAYTFSSYLIIFYKLDFWNALETSRKIITKRWWSFFLFSIVIVAINLAGVLALGVGVLITIPLSIAATYAAYDDIVGID